MVCLEYIMTNKQKGYSRQIKDLKVGESVFIDSYRYELVIVEEVKKDFVSFEGINRILLENQEHWLKDFKWWMPIVNNIRMFVLSNYWKLKQR